MKLPPINATVLAVTLAVCGTAVWCAERIRPPDRRRYEYFEDNTKIGHYIVEVDTDTGNVSRRATSGKYAGNFSREEPESRLWNLCQWIADVVSIPITAMRNTPANARLTTNWNDIDWILTRRLVATIAVILAQLFAIVCVSRWLMSIRVGTRRSKVST